MKTKTREKRIQHYVISTRSKGDGSEACYAVWFEREIVATFPINDPASPDASEYAKRFAASMERYYKRQLARLTKRASQ